MSKNLVVASDISMGGRLFLGSEIGKISVFDISINDDASVFGNLHIGGALITNYRDESIPQSAIIGGVGSNVFTEDIQGGARAFVDEDVTFKKRLFVGSDLSLGGNIFLGDQKSRIDVKDISINNDLTVAGVLTASFAENTIPKEAIIGGVGSNVFTEDIIAGARAFVDEDVTFKKRLFIVDDLSLGGNVFLGSRNSRIDVKDISINNDLTVTGNLNANYPDESIPQSAIVGGVGSNEFTKDIIASARAFVDEDVSFKKRLFVGNDLSLAGKLFMTGSSSQANVYDISVNNDLTVTGNIMGNFPAESIPQSAIIGGVGSNEFTKDIVASARAFVDEDVFFKKRLFVGNDLSLGGNIFMTGSNSSININDLNVTNELVVDKDVTIKGQLNVQQYSNENIINTTTNNYQLIVSEDLSLNGNLSVSNDAEVTNRLFIGPSERTFIAVSQSSTAEMNQIGFFTADTEHVRIGSDGTVFLGSPSSAQATGTLHAGIVSGIQVDANASNIQTANITTANISSAANVADLTVTGTINIPDASIPASAIVGEVASTSSGAPNFLLDVSMNKRLFVKSDLSMGGDLTVVGDASFNNTLQTQDLVVTGTTTSTGDASFNNTLQAKDLVVTGTTTFAAASIKAEAIDGNVGGADFTNDISMNKRLFIESDLSMAGNLVVLSDASINGTVSGKTINATDLVVTGTTTFPTASINGSAIAGTVGADYGIDIHMEKRLFVDSDVSFGGDFLVVNDTSLNNNVDIGGNLNVTGTLKSTGNITANVTGNVSGTAATVTENTQGAITTLPSLTNIGAAGATLLAEGNLQATNLLASNDALINGMISVIGDIDVNSGKFVVSGANGNTTVAGALNITAGGGINNSGATVLASTLAVSGETTLSNNVSVVGGTLGVSGVTTLSDAATVGGTLGVTGATTLSDTATVGGTLGVTGVTTLSDAATVGGTLGVTGVTTLSDAATVGGTLGVGGNLTVDTNKFEVVAASGNTSVGGTLSITSDLAVNGTNFTVAGATGNTSVAGTLGVTGVTTLSDNASVGGTLTVTGATTLNDNVSVADTKTFTVGSGASSLGGSLTVTGATTLNDNVSVADAKTFTVGSGASSLGGSLTVAGATTLNDNVSVADAKTFTVGTGASSLGGSLTVEGETIINDNLFIKSGGTNKVSITQTNGNFKNTGYLWSDSQLIIGDTDKFSVLGTNGNTEIGGNLKINTDKFVVTAASGNTAIAGTLDVTGDTKINTDKFVVTAASGNTAIAGTLDIAEDTKINTDKFVVTAASGNTAIAGTLDVDGNAVLKSDLSLNQQLFVGQNAVFDKDVTIEGNLSVQQYQSENIINTTTTNYQLIVSEDLSLNGRLFADYDASFGANIFVENKSILHNDVSMNSRLFVFGDVSMNNDLFVNEKSILNNDVSMNSRLFVFGDSSFNNNVFVRGALDVSGAISMDGDVSLNSSLFTANDISVNGINIGRGAGNSDTNTVVGKDALITNSTGTKNTAFGIDSLKFNTTGISNTATGQKSLFNNAQGSYNTAFGTEALLDTTAGYNTGIGYQALKSNTTGTNNTAIGNAAGLNSQQGTSNTFVGYAADVDTNSVGTIDFSTAVGYNAKATESNQVMIGGDATNGRIFLNANDISGNAGTLDVKLINFTAESIPANAVEGSSSETTSLTGRVIMNADLRVDGSANFQHDVTVGQRAWLQDRLYVGGRVDVVNDASFNANVQMANINGMVSFVTTGNVEIAGAISQGTALDASEYTNYEARTVSPAFTADVIRTSTNGQYVAIYDDATGNQMYISKDYGATFTTVSLGTTGTGITDSTYDINRRVSMDETGQYIVLVGNSNVCWSNNYGVSFSTSLSDSTLTYTCASTNGQYLAVGTNNEKLYISTNYGATLPAHAQGPVNIEGDDGSGGSGEKHNWRHVVVNSTGKYIACVTDTKIYGYADAAAAYGSSSVFTNNTTNSTLTGAEITALQTLHMTRDGNYIFTSIDGAVYRAPTGSITNGSWKNTTVQSTSGAYWNISTTTTSGMDGRFLYLVDKNNAGKVLASNDYGATIADDPQSSDASRDYQNITVTGNGAYTYANTATGLFVKEYKDGTTASIVTGEAFILSQDASFNNRIFVDHDVSFNKRLFVGENSILNGDVSMNSKMNIEGDLSMNSRLFVKKSANANVFMESYQTGITEMDVRVVSKTAQHRFYNNGSAMGYLVNEGESPYLTFVPGKSYRFLQDDSTNGTHQIKFYLSPDKTTLYENGVTYNGTAGSAGAYTQIDVSMGTPSVLYYQCVNHGLMGNQINVLGSKSFDGDLSYNVIKLPSGTTSQRPASIERGVVRYNTTTDQFEGYGAGDAWGSLGGIIDVDQDTYIKAETAANDDNDQLQFFTAGSQRMIIGNNGDISMNHDLKLNSDNAKITLGLDDDITISHYAITNALDVDSVGPLSLNSSAGVINIGDDAVTGAINIGTSDSARNINIGHDTSQKVDINAASIEIDAGASGLALNSDGVIQLKAADQREVTLGNSTLSTYMSVVTHTTKANEYIDIKNQDGTGTNAIRLNAESGGIDIDAAATKTADIAAGKILLTSKDDAADAILIKTDVGTSEKITLYNGKGTADDSIRLQSVAGGVYLQSQNQYIGLTSSKMDLQSANDMDIITNANNANINVLPNGSGTLTLGADANTKVDVNASAIELDAGATGMTLNSETTIDVNAAGVLSLNSTSSTGGLLLDSAAGGNSIRIFARGAGATDSKIKIRNEVGEDDDAFEFQSNAGGMELKSAKLMAITTTANNANINVIPDGSGTLTLGQDTNTKVDINASEIELDAGTGGIKVISDGTGNAAIDFEAAAGGIRFHCADEKRIKFMNNDGDSYFQLESSATPANEKFDMYNAQGTAADAIRIKALNGGLTFDAGTTMELIAANGVTITGTTTMSDALDVNSTADISGKLTLSKASGTGLEVTSDATVGGNLVVTGNMTVNGTTTTISTTNTTVSDSLMELSSGTSGTPANDAGLIIERGSSDNAFIGWDESADKFIVGTTTATGADTGDLSVTAGTLVANLEGNVTGDLTGTVLTVAQNTITTMTGLTAIGATGVNTTFSGPIVASEGLGVTTDASITKRLFVTEDASFNAGLFVNEDVSFNSSFFVSGDASFNSGFSVLGDASFNKGIYMYGDVSWNPSNIAASSIPSSAIIGGVGSNNFTTDVSMNQRLFIGGDISMNMGSFIHQF